MKKSFLVISFIILANLFVSAQKNTKPVFNSFLTGGLVFGKDIPGSYSVQSVNGIMMGKWFVGAGIGYDWQSRRSVPVFIDLKYAIRNFFVYTDGGVHFPVKETPDASYLKERSPAPGLYLDGGIGYTLRAGKKNEAIIFTLGNSLKAYTIRRELTTLDVLPRIRFREDYRLSRIMLRVGIRL